MEIYFKSHTLPKKWRYLKSSVILKNEPKWSSISLDDLGVVLFEGRKGDKINRLLIISLGIIGAPRIVSGLYPRMCVCVCVCVYLSSGVLGCPSNFAKDPTFIYLSGLPQMIFIWIMTKQVKTGENCWNLHRGHSNRYEVGRDTLTYFSGLFLLNNCTWLCDDLALY